MTYFVGRKQLLDGFEVIDGRVRDKVVGVGWLYLIADSHRARWLASPGCSFVRDATLEDGELPEGSWCALFKRKP